MLKQPRLAHLSEEEYDKVIEELKKLNEVTKTVWKGRAEASKILEDLKTSHGIDFRKHKESFVQEKYFKVLKFLDDLDYGIDCTIMMF